MIMLFQCTPHLMKNLSENEKIKKRNYAGIRKNNMSKQIYEKLLL